MDHLREWNGIVLLCTVQQGLLVYWYLFLSLWTSVQGWYTNKDPTRLFTESTLSLASWALGFPWESKRHNGYFFGSETIWYSVDRGLYKGLLCQRHSLLWLTGIYNGDQSPSVDFQNTSTTTVITAITARRLSRFEDRIYQGEYLPLLSNWWYGTTNYWSSQQFTVFCPACV